MQHVKHSSFDQQRRQQGQAGARARLMFASVQHRQAGPQQVTVELRKLLCWTHRHDGMDCAAHRRHGRQPVDEGNLQGRAQQPAEHLQHLPQCTQPASGLKKSPSPAKCRRAAETQCQLHLLPGQHTCAGLTRVSQPRCGVAMHTKWQGARPATVLVAGSNSRPTA